MKKLIAVIFILSLFTPELSAQTKVERELLFNLPFKASESLGIRVYKNKVFAAARDGRVIAYNLKTGALEKSKEIGSDLIDFAIILGSPVFINGNGKIRGRRRIGWPDRVFEACRIDVLDNGVFLSGGSHCVYLAKTATEALYIDNMNFACPMGRGFVWSAGKKANGSWGVYICDSFGQPMQEGFEFAEGFEPAGLELVGLGPEDELLISFYDGGTRKLSLISNSGVMFWKLDWPQKLIARDVCLDNAGSLIIVEDLGEGLVVNRLKMSFPEG